MGVVMAVGLVLLGYSLCLAIYQMISVETLYFVISILKKVPRLPSAFYRVLISLISNNNIRSMYGETTSLPKKATASNHEIFNNPPASLKDLVIPSVILGCAIFTNKNHGNMFETISAKIFAKILQIITTIMTIFL